MLKYLYVLISFLMYSCDGDLGNNPISGCMDQFSCNYNQNASEEDGSCIYSNSGFDCDGNCIADIDCDGVCGGSAILDDCGICNGESISCFGCTDSSACNYNDTAILDDGTCIFPNECNLCEECDLSVGSIYLTNDSELWYNVSEDITGFQFDVYGVTILDILNGDAQNSGFEVIYQNGSSFSRVLGYSLSGNIINSGCGMLLDILYDGVVADIDNIVFATTFGEQMNIDYTVCP